MRRWRSTDPWPYRRRPGWDRRRFPVQLSADMTARLVLAVLLAAATWSLALMLATIVGPPG